MSRLCEDALHRTSTEYCAAESNATAADLTMSGAFEYALTATLQAATKIDSRDVLFFIICIISDDFFNNTLLAARDTAERERFPAAFTAADKHVMSNLKPLERFATVLSM